MNNCYTIKIPSKLSISSVDIMYGKISKYLNDIPYELHLNFDFSDVTFITPEGLILLVTVSRFLYTNHKYYIEWKNIIKSVLSYIERMHINDFEFIHIKRDPKFIKKIHNRSNVLVEISTIKEQKEIGIAIYNTRLILNNWFPQSKSDCRRHLLTLIKETVENSIEHSSPEPLNGYCYYILQKYTYSNGQNEVQIAVGDAGVGMLFSQQRIYPDTKNDEDAIVSALIYGRSGRNSEYGGIGYVNIRESLEPLNGKIFIRSGKAHVEFCSKDTQPKIYKHEYNSPGTQIIFKCRA